MNYSLLPLARLALRRVCLVLLLCSLSATGAAAGQEFTIVDQARLAGKAQSKGPTLEQMAGAMLMFGFRGTTFSDPNPFLEWVRSGKVGHVILFDKDHLTGGPRNIGAQKEVRQLTATLKDAARGPFLIAVDQEGGKVRRLKPGAGYIDTPSAESMGRGKPENTRALARLMGEELHDLGIQVNMAPVADVNTNPDNPAIGALGRSFNADPALVTRHALAFGQAMQEEKIIPVLKHFPGHGSSVADTHAGQADITATWNSMADLKPFVDAIGSRWPGMIMTGHLTHTKLDPVYPASLSKLITQDMLRSTLGWNGVVVTDDLQMDAIATRFSLEETILLAVNAGADILLFGNNLRWDPLLPETVHGTLMQLIRKGAITSERVRESWERITGLYYSYYGVNLSSVRPPLVRIH